MTTYHYKRITRPAFVSPSVLLLDHYFSLPRAQREREGEGERREGAADGPISPVAGLSTPDRQTRRGAKRRDGESAHAREEEGVGNHC